MPSLYTLIKKMPEKKWNYYKGFSNNISISKPIVTSNTSAHFIKQYFKKGG